MGIQKDAEKGGRKVATLSQLKKKTPVRKEVTLVVNDEDGNAEEVTLTFQSIGSKEYDQLQAKFKPTPEQKKEGLTYNPDKFGPALLAATCVDPESTQEDWEEIWESDAWNRGELMVLFMQAIEVNTRGHDLPPTESD